MENLNINFEEILVKNLISNNRFLGITAGFLVDSAFANIANKEIYKIVKNYYITYSKAPNVSEIVAAAKNIPNTELKTLIAEQIKKIIPQEVISNEEFLIEQTVSFAKKEIGRAHV